VTGKRCKRAGKILGRSSMFGVVLLMIMVVVVVMVMVLL